jgi:WXG100 family type VII secretion target
VRIAVPHEKVAGLVAEMSIVSENIALVLDELDRESKLLQTQWTGEAREAYRAAHAQWSAAHQGMNQVLRELTRRLANTNQHSIDAHTHATDIWN